MAKNLTPKPLHTTTSGWENYEILDSGHSKKLERFGPVHLVRFEPRALWKPALPPVPWQEAVAEFHIRKGYQTGEWHIQPDIPTEWILALDGLTVQLRIQKSRHIGIFPEQYPGWKWIEERVRSASGSPKILNLFGYTGLATLFAARAGAQVTHVDAARSAVKWAQQNQHLSRLADAPIRWIVDDAFKFVEREGRRGNHYDGILLDPPHFGRGPKGEVWKFDKAVQALLHACCNILAPQPLFLYLTAYDVQQEPAELFQWVKQCMTSFKGQMDYGWMVQQEKSAGRKIEQSMFVRCW
jgi:23S rRNA (cytosine1962-C5)-methyltransferase